METDRIGNLALPGSSASRAVLAAANGLDHLVTRICRFVVLVTGVALTAILTGSVAARYVFAAGGIDAAQELPERLFPWFIVAGAVLAAQAGRTSRASRAATRRPCVRRPAPRVRRPRR